MRDYTIYVSDNGQASITWLSNTVQTSSTFTGVAGTVGGLDPDLVRQIASHPANFYVDLHTADFPGGAVRGQLFDAGHRDAAPTVTS